MWLIKPVPLFPQGFLLEQMLNEVKNQGSWLTGFV